MKKVVIIGGNAAGLSAASQVKRRKPDWEAVVLEKGPYISYASCGIPYYVQGLVSDLDKLLNISPEEAVNKRKINLKMHHEATSFDPQEKNITVDTPAGTVTEDFDYLVIATGARPLKSSIAYSPSKRIFTANYLNDAVSIRSFLEEHKPAKCAVIGGGYIAIEMLEALKDRGLDTHLIHRREDLSRNFEKEISDLAKSEMIKEKIILHLNCPVTRITEQENSVEVHTSREKFNYDLVIVATGVEPNSTLAQNSGIETGIKGAIRVNERMQTNYPDIYAAGDCAETRDLVTGNPFYVALALKANKEGVVAGINASGGREIFPGVLGTAVTKFFNLGLARTGLTLAEAEKCGFGVLKFTVEARSRSHYYPGGGPLTVVLIATKKEGRLLGAQLAGPVDAVKRIDVYATAITAGMTVNQIFELDLAYAPPFSPVYDPVILSGRVGRKKVAE